MNHNTVKLIVETSFYMFMKIIKISKFTIGLSFFIMDYVITHCVVLTNKPATGVCTVVEQYKTWFIERTTKGNCKDLRSSETTCTFQINFV